MQLVKLLQAFTTEHAILPDVVLSGVGSDSRNIQPGELFCVTVAEKQAAQRYIEQAITNGAVAIAFDPQHYPPESLQTHGVPCFPVPALAACLGEIASTFWGEPSKAMTIIAVTGTNGKTSCCHYIAQALQHLGQKVALLGTVGNGIVTALSTSPLTTLDPVSLQKKLAEFRDSGVEIVVLEASSHGIAQHRLAGTAIDYGVFTNLTREHLDYHGSMQAYAAVKRRLFDWPTLQGAVINADDPIGCAWLTELTAEKSYNITGFSLQQLPLKQVFWIKGQINSQNKKRGAMVRISCHQTSFDVQTQLLGDFNVSNLLAVIGILQNLGLSTEAVSNVIPKIQAVIGRMQCFGGGELPLVVVDYAHTPDALAKALSNLREITPQQLWCVFGCGGDRDTGKRSEMGKVAAIYSNQIILTNDNPRHEAPQQIIDAIRVGMDDQIPVQIELDRQQAIATAIERATSEDVILVAGKGHEQFQLIGEQRLPLSDQHCVEMALNKYAKTMQSKVKG